MNYRTVCCFLFTLVLCAAAAAQTEVYRLPGFYSPSAFGPDSSVYLLSRAETPLSRFPDVYSDSITKVNSDGSIAWKMGFPSSGIVAIYPVGTGAYLLFRADLHKDNSINYVNGDGTIRWSKMIEGEPYLSAIDPSGNFYQNTGTTLLKYDTLGNLLFTAPLPAQPHLRNLESSQFEDPSLFCDGQGRLWLILEMCTEVVKKNGNDSTDEYDGYMFLTILNPNTGLPLNAKKPWSAIISKEVLNKTIVKGRTTTYYSEDALFGPAQMMGDRLVITFYDQRIMTEKQTPGKHFSSDQSAWRYYLVNASGKVKQFTYRGKGVDECKTATSHTISDGVGNWIDGVKEGAGNMLYVGGAVATGKAKCGAPALKENEVLMQIDPIKGKINWKTTVPYYENHYDGVWGGGHFFCLNGLPFVQNNAEMTSYLQYNSNGKPGTVTLNFPSHPAKLYGPIGYGDNIYMNHIIGADTFFVKYSVSTMNFARNNAVENSDKPKKFSLQQNYPNPFNPETKIAFSLPVDAAVSLTIYNMLGQRVAAVLDREEMTAGDQEIEFNAANLASGAYFYRLTAEGTAGKGTTSRTYTDIKKMMLIK